MKTSLFPPPLDKHAYLHVIADDCHPPFSLRRRRLDLVEQAYGKRTFLITTFKAVPPGTEGAVSLEGTLAGVVGSIFLAGFAAAAGVITIKVSSVDSGQ